MCNSVRVKVVFINGNVFPVAEVFIRQDSEAPGCFLDVGHNIDQTKSGRAIQIRYLLS